MHCSAKNISTYLKVFFAYVYWHLQGCTKLLATDFQEVDAANSRASKAEEALAEAQEQAAQQLQSQKFSLDQLRRESEEVVRSLEEERDTLTAQMSVAQVPTNKLYNATLLGWCI